MIPIIASSLFALVLLNKVRLNSIVKGRMGLQSCLKCTQVVMKQKGKGGKGGCVEPPPKRARLAGESSLASLAPVLVEESQEADAMHETQASGPAAAAAPAPQTQLADALKDGAWGMLFGNDDEQSQLPMFPAAADSLESQVLRLVAEGTQDSVDSLQLPTNPTVAALANTVGRLRAGGGAAAPAVAEAALQPAAEAALPAVAGAAPPVALEVAGSQGAVVQVTSGMERRKLKSGTSEYNKTMNKFIRRINHASCPPKYPLSAWLCASFQRYGFLHVALYSFIFSHGSS